LGGLEVSLRMRLEEGQGLMLGMGGTFFIAFD